MDEPQSVQEIAGPGRLASPVNGAHPLYYVTFCHSPALFHRAPCSTWQCRANSHATLPGSATPGTAAAIMPGHLHTPALLHAPNRSTALRTVTISAMTISVAFSAAPFAYFPITRGELVSHIRTKTVMGSCKDKST